MTDHEFITHDEGCPYANKIPGHQCMRCRGSHEEWGAEDDGAVAQALWFFAKLILGGLGVIVFLWQVAT